jgi:hypothetical protein
LLPALEFLHQRLAIALITFAAVLGIWGAVLLVTRGRVTGGFRSGFLLLPGLTALQGLAGAGTYALGAPPKEILHFVYGAFALLFLPGMYVAAGRWRGDREALALSLSCWVVAIAYARGFATGG